MTAQDNRTDIEREIDESIEDIRTAHRNSEIIGTGVGVLIACGLLLGFFYFIGAFIL